MIEKLKSKTIGYWLMSVAILAAIVGIVLFAVYKNRGGEGIPAVFAFAAIGIACQVILFFYDGKFGALFAIAAVVMYALALGFNLSGGVGNITDNVLGIVIYGHPELAVMNYAMAVVFGIGMLLSAVGCFMNRQKEGA